MSDKPYCGAKKTPKNRKSGSMKECVEAKQIRKFGLKKVDPKILASKAKAGPSKRQLEKKQVILRGERRKINSNLPYEKDDKKKEQMKKELKEIKNKLLDIQKQLNKLKKK